MMKKNGVIALLLLVPMLTLMPPVFTQKAVDNPEEEEYIRSRVVQLDGNGHACTGIQVHSSTGKDYVMTAAHCSVLKDDNNSILVSSEAMSRPMPRKVIEVSPVSDLMLLEGLPNLKGIAIAEVAPDHRRYSAYTHGERLPTHRADGEYLGQMSVEIGISQIDTPADHDKCVSVPKQIDLNGMCVLAVVEEVTSIAVEPGSSGGPIVNGRFELVGIVSASDGRFSFMVPIEDIKKFIKPY
jgi:hypothetical protein